MRSTDIDDRASRAAASTAPAGRPVTSALRGTVPCLEIDIPPEMAADGVQSDVLVDVSRTILVVAFWRDGIETAGTYSGAGSTKAAQAKALQRAYSAGVSLRARWAAARSEFEAS